MQKGKCTSFGLLTCMCELQFKKAKSRLQGCEKYVCRAMAAEEGRD